MSVENEVRAALRRAGGWARGPGRGRGVAAALVGCLVLGGVLTGVEPDRDDGGDTRAGRVTGAAGPGARRAGAAMVAGVPVALTEVAVAVREHEARVRVRPRDDASWAVLGTAYTERARRTGRVADYPKADRALRTSLRLRPAGNTAALEGLAALASARRDFRAAKRWGEEAVRVAPARWTSYALLIDAYDGLGRYKAARASLDRMLAAYSGPAARARAAQVYWDRGAREDAAATLSDAAASETTAAGPSAAGALWWTRAGELAWERGRRRSRCGTARPRAASRTPTRAGGGRWPRWGGRRRVCAPTGWRCRGGRRRGSRCGWASCTSRWGAGGRRASSTAWCVRWWRGPPRPG
nr:hypothetical protein [Streptomyces sp. LBUM 1477]